MAAARTTTTDRRRNGARSPGARPATRTAFIRPPRQFGTDTLKELKPQRMAAMLERAAGGDIEDWIDLADKMEDIDEHLAGLIETRTQIVAQTERKIEPGPGGDPQLAQMAARDCELAFSKIEDLDVLDSDLLDGVYKGVGLLEHDWREDPETGLVWSQPFWVDQRNFRWGTEWQWEIRNLDRMWVEMPTDKFIVHMPRNRATVPTKTALLRSCVWIWIFKYWAWFFWTGGAERLANPMMLAKVPRNANKDVRDKALEALEELSADQAAVIEEEVGIAPLDIKYVDSAEVWENLISKCDAGMSKRIHGATLIAEVGKTGGARATASEQGALAVKPRAKADAKRLCGTWRRDYFRPFLEMNLSRYGGVMPPVPILKRVFDDAVVKDPNIVSIAVKARAVRRNELRAMIGLEAVSAEEGGNDWVGGEDLDDEEQAAVTPGEPEPDPDDEEDLDDEDEADAA